MYTYHTIIIIIIIMSNEIIFKTFFFFFSEYYLPLKCVEICPHFQTKKVEQIWLQEVLCKNTIQEQVKREYINTN